MAIIYSLSSIFMLADCLSFTIMIFRGVYPTISRRLVSSNSGGDDPEFLEASTGSFMWFACFKQHVHPSANIGANRLAPKTTTSQCCTAIPAIRSMSGLRLFGEVLNFFRDSMKHVDARARNAHFLVHLRFWDSAATSQLLNNTYLFVKNKAIDNPPFVDVICMGSMFIFPARTSSMGIKKQILQTKPVRFSGFEVLAFFHFRSLILGSIQISLTRWPSLFTQKHYEINNLCLQSMGLVICSPPIDLRFFENPIVFFLHVEPIPTSPAIDHGK